MDASLKKDFFGGHTVAIVIARCRLNQSPMMIARKGSGKNQRGQPSALGQPLSKYRVITLDLCAGTNLKK